jgi:hypothetical protein
LQWYQIKKGDKMGGEILAAFELFLVRCILSIYVVESVASTTYCVCLG